jgi:modulator of FtsH protease HflC
MLSDLWQNNRTALVAAGAVVLAALSSVVVVPETEQAVVIRLGEPNRVINRFRPDVPFGETGAGLTWRIPFIERMVRIDRRILSVDMDSQEVLSTDQLRLQVDAYARFRIIDPVRMVRTAGTSDRVIEQLQPIFTSVLRQELGKRTFQSLLTADRGAAMINIRQELDKEAREYGAQIIDVRIKRADLPEGALESTFARMSAAREQEAVTIRAEGQKNAQIIRAEAEAQAAKIYADAFNKDPAFYDFYRAMKSYDATFADPENKKAGSTIILSPDNDYLRQFRGR